MDQSLIPVTEAQLLSLKGVNFRYRLVDNTGYLYYGKMQSDGVIDHYWAKNVIDNGSEIKYYFLDIANYLTITQIGKYL